MTIQDSIMDALQKHHAKAMYLPNIRVFLPDDVTNGKADAELQKLIQNGLVKKGERSIKGFLYHLTPSGEKYKIGESMESLPEIEPPADFASAIVRNDLTRLDGALSYAESKHYAYEYKGVKLDPYRIFRVYDITAPEQQHAIKKLLRAGKSVKPLMQDIDETIATLERWKQILNEDNNHG